MTVEARSMERRKQAGFDMLLYAIKYLFRNKSISVVNQ